MPPTGRRRRRGGGGRTSHSSLSPGLVASSSAAASAVAVAALGQAGNTQKNDGRSAAIPVDANNYLPGAGDPSDVYQSDGVLDGVDAPAAQQSQRAKNWREVAGEAKELLQQLRSDEHNAHRLAGCTRALVQLHEAYIVDYSASADHVYARNLQSFVDSVRAFTSSTKATHIHTTSDAEEYRAVVSHDAGEACDAVLAECADNDPFADNHIIAVGAGPHRDGGTMVGTAMAAATEVEPVAETTGGDVVAVDPLSSVAEGKGAESVGAAGTEGAGRRVRGLDIILATKLAHAIWDSRVVNCNLSHSNADCNAIRTIALFLGRSHDGAFEPAAMALRAVAGGSPVAPKSAKDKERHERAVAAYEASGHVIPIVIPEGPGSFGMTIGSDDKKLSGWALIQDVRAGSKAETAGLRVDDKPLSRGQRISHEAFLQMIESAERPFTFEVFRRVAPPTPLPPIRRPSLPPNPCNMQRIFGTHATMAAEEATKLLAKLNISQDGPSDTFERIYGHACNFNWDGQRIKKQLIAEGAITGRGTLPPALPVHNLSSGCSKMPSRPTLVFLLVRWSPATDNNGYTQVVRMILALLYQAMKGVGDFEVHPTIFAGPEVKRDKSYKSGGIEQLFQALQITPDDRNTLVLANEVLRISDKPQQVGVFGRSVKALQDNAEVKTLKEHDMHLVPAVSILATEASQRSNICATIGSHCNAGRDADIDPAFEPMRERVEQLSCEIHSDITSYESQLTDATNCGTEHPDQPAIAKLWRAATKGLETTDGELQQEMVEKAALDFIASARKSVSEIPGSRRKRIPGRRRIAIYLRSSDTNRKMVYRLPLDQLVSCLARAKIEYGDDVLSNFELLVFHDVALRTRLCNAAFAKLLSVIAAEPLDGVIIPDPTRVSERVEANELLSFVCRKTNMALLFSRLVGQDHSTVAQTEGQRTKSLRTVLDERKRKVEDQRKEDIPCGAMRARSEVLQKISGMRSFPGVVIPQKKWDRQAELAKAERKRKRDAAERERELEQPVQKKKRIQNDILQMEDEEGKEHYRNSGGFSFGLARDAGLPAGWSAKLGLRQFQDPSGNTIWPHGIKAAREAVRKWESK